MRIQPRSIPCSILTLVLFFGSNNIVFAQERSLPIVRQTEAEMEKAFLQVLSGKKVRRQGKDETYPEQKEELGQKLAHYLSPAIIAEVFIPFEARSVSDAQIDQVFSDTVITKYEDLEPMALKACDLIRVTDHKDYSYDFCIFSDAKDLRGTITFPNYQRFWFRLPQPAKPQTQE